MKKLFLSLSILLFTFSPLWLEGATRVGPKTASQGASADGLVVSVDVPSTLPTRRVSQMATANPASATVLNFWVMGPTKSDPTYGQFARNTINQVMAGVYPTNFIGWVVTSENMTTSKGMIPWNVIWVTAKQGSTVRMSDLVTRVNCPQDPGLFEEQTFLGSSYAFSAPGIRNNEWVESGSASQEVESFFVLVAPKTYTDSFEVVRNWIEVQNANSFSLTMEMNVGGARALSTISTQGYTASLPTLTIQLEIGNNVSLGFPNGNQGRSYVVMSLGTTISMWDDSAEKLVGNVIGTDRVLWPIGHASEFFDFIWQ